MLTSPRHWSHHVSALLSAVMPASCALCGDNGNTGLCKGCREQFLQTRPRCRQCAIPLPYDAPNCGACLKQTPAFDATIVAADYAPPIDQLVLALKFGGRLELAPLFAGLIHDALCRVGLPDTSMLMIAVPLGQRRLTERGFNQALEIAKPLARSLGTQLKARAVVRQRDTVAQSLLHPDERHKNLRDAFAVCGSAAEHIRDRHIAVVDDVMTTGETLNALAVALKRAGAASVTNLVLARTPQK